MRDARNIFCTVVLFSTGIGVNELCACSSIRMRISETSYTYITGGCNSLTRISVKRLNHCAYNERSAAIIRCEQKGFVVMKNVTFARRFIQTRFMCNFSSRKTSVKALAKRQAQFSGSAARHSGETTEAAGTLLSKS